MRSKPPECIGCPLYELGSGFVEPQGSCGNGVLLMGEAPGAEEASTSLPFQGPAGKMLDRILTTGKMDRNDYGIINVLQCRPPDNELLGMPYEAAAIAHCKVHRDKAVARFRPSLIIALGDTAFRTLTGESGITEKRGYHYPTDYGVPVIGTFHPAHLIYDRAKAKTQAKGRAGMSLMQSVIFDIKLAPNIPRENPALDPACSPVMLQNIIKWCRDNPSAWIANDIETPNSGSLTEEDIDINDPSYTINYFSCAVPISMANGPEEPGGIEVRALSYPWQEPYITLTKELLALPNEKLYWNYLFDVPRLEHNGCKVNGTIVDVMWLFHWLFSDLKRGLGSAGSYYLGVPEWKSKKDQDLAYYSAMDSWATGRLYQEITKHLTKNNCLEMATRHVTQLLAVLRRMSARGVTINIRALSEFRSYLDSQLEVIANKLDKLWPDALRQYHPTEGYVREPKDKGGMITREFTLIPKPTKKNPNPDPTPITVTRWCTPVPYNPASPKEILKYADHKNHTLTERSGKRLTSSEERYLSVLQNRYSDYIYEGTIAYRGIGKLRGTYTNWPLYCQDCSARLTDLFTCPTHGEVSVGIIHTRFTLAPATGRLSSTQPNVQNIPNDEEDPLPMRFRRCITARSGHILVRADYKGIEAVLTGWFASDAEYMKLALIGAHAYNTACYLRDVMKQPITIPHVDSPELPPLLKQVKKANKTLYSKIKKVGHGINYGEGPFKIFDQNPGMFATRSEAKSLWAFIRKLIGKVIEWQNRTVLQAATTKKIVNPFGRPRWFWDIPGEDGPAAIAQQPQSTAADIIFEAMLAVDADPLIGPYLVWQIHDELVLDVPLEIKEQAAARLTEIMERPIPQLGGLVIGADVKIGMTLAPED